jgi:gamma-glutamyl-gamma-aminobutyraldehyde dehydrogenase
MMECRSRVALNSFRLIRRRLTSSQSARKVITDWEALMLLQAGKADILDRAGQLRAPGLALIDGRAISAITGTTFSNVSPRDGSVLNEVAACDAADIDAAVASARRAFEDGRWRGLGPRGMKAVLHRLADLMESHADELALLESLDVGKPIRDAVNVDLPLSIRAMRYYAEALDKVYGEVGPSPDNRLSMAVWEPLGVVGAIVPWNFPLMMAVWKLAPALAMGNSVVLKPA